VVAITMSRAFLWSPESVPIPILSSSPRPIWDRASMNSFRRFLFMANLAHLFQPRRHFLRHSCSLALSLPHCAIH